jgi:hypothetical protein
MMPIEQRYHAKIPAPGGLKKHVPECGHTKGKH